MWRCAYTCDHEGLRTAIRFENAAVDATTDNSIGGPILFRELVGVADIGARVEGWVEVDIVVIWETPVRGHRSGSVTSDRGKGGGSVACSQAGQAGRRRTEAEARIPDAWQRVLKHGVAKQLREQRRDRRRVDQIIIRLAPHAARPLWLRESVPNFLVSETRNFGADAVAVLGVQVGDVRHGEGGGDDEITLLDERCPLRVVHRPQRRQQQRGSSQRRFDVFSTAMGRDNVKWRLAVNFDWRTYVCMFVWSQKLVGINESWRYSVA